MTVRSCLHSVERDGREAAGPGMRLGGADTNGPPKAVGLSHHLNSLSTRRDSLQFNIRCEC